MSKVLVTTASGHIGRYVVQECLDLGLSVRAGVRDPATLEPQQPDLETVAFDFTDPNTWPEALRGCNLLFLLRPPPLGNMQSTLIPFVDAAYAEGFNHVVFVSVAGADRMKWIPHRQVEQHLMEHRQTWTILRPGFFAQNFETAYRRDIVEEDRVIVPAGNGRAAFIDVRDIAAVAARTLQDPVLFQKRTLTLTGPEAVSFSEATEILSSVLNRTIRYEPATVPGYAWHLKRKHGLPAMQILVQSILHAGLRKGSADEVNDTVEEVLGQAPRSLRQYFEDHRNVWQRADAP
jgi:uncharacterized protein YbjT (DUF2867 family)